MNNKKYTLPTALIGVMTAVLLAFVLVRTFLPNFLIPALDVPNMVLISLVALIIDHYAAPGAKRCYICTFLFSAITFGALPYVSGFTAGWDVLKLGLVGGAVFTVLTWLFTSVQVRLSSGPAAKLAPIMSAFGIWLAVQAFAGIGL